MVSEKNAEIRIWILLTSVQINEERAIVALKKYHISNGFFHTVHPIANQILIVLLFAMFQLNFISEVEKDLSFLET